MTRPTIARRRKATRRHPGDLLAVLGLAVALVLGVVGSSATAGTSGPGSAAALPAGLTAAGTSEKEYIPAGLTTQRTWSSQTASVPDFSFAGDARAKLTARTDVGLRAALAAGVINLSNVRCWDEHAWNPTSDHPLGKACDLFQDYRTSAGVAAGWRAANWFVANQAKLGIYYVIWQNEFWGAYSPKAWGPYRSTVYGCPDPTNITGCHMDHIHISFY
ncbi:hypothetical protein JL107_07890 [Nakamurella flavida]|uniref:ARB-07466-like C-terminal domain-containing protein n=1 Tax=Nakamurella flavida TaxID=363630 RepID=A0A939C5N0_9ACTN|nr:hypothetical protein [Nakamurella flavida]MBM9476357.1 hypothetical protein [Nakamurella flavida]MDP9779543.1 hypothetical protein [Nakamurella flavida]